MKQLFFLPFLLISFSSLSAQGLKNLYLELDLVRYAKETGGTPGYENNYKHGFDFVRGAGIGYSFHPKWSIYSKYRRINNTFSGQSELAPVKEVGQTKGHEFNAGIEWAPGSGKRRFHLSYAFEVFGEFVASTGSCHIHGWCPVGEPEYELAERKTMIGFAPKLRFNFNLAKGFSLFADARVKVGKVSIHEPNELPPGHVVNQAEGYWLNSYDSLNALGIKFSF